MLPGKAMHILTALTYYRPHVSGVTVYAQRLAEALAAGGHAVTVLTSQWDSTLPRDAMENGVRVRRVPVVARVSKGVIMPTIGMWATRMVLAHDVVHLHLPQFDAAGIALRAWLSGRPSVLTFHCDLQLPPGWFNRAAGRVVRAANFVAGRCADRIVTYTDDYRRHSGFLSRWNSKTVLIDPPVALPTVTDQEAARFRMEHGLDSSRGPVLAMAARLASEKGVEVLLAALPRILAKYPRAIVLFAGQHRNVLGEQAYADRLMPRIRELEAAGHWRFLGVLDPCRMAAFYRHVDVLVVPSLNSTESFGLVQIEAMMHGVPVAVSDLPGVRTPVASTGMGRVVPTGDADALAAAVLELLALPRPLCPPSGVFGRYDPRAVAARYETLFEHLLQERR